MAGTTNAGTGGECEAGYKCSAGSKEQVACQLGEYNPDTKQENCRVSSCWGTPTDRVCCWVTPTDRVCCWGTPT